MFVAAVIDTFALLSGDGTVVVVVIFIIVAFIVISIFSSC